MNSVRPRSVLREAIVSISRAVFVVLLAFGLSACGARSALHEPDVRSDAAERSVAPDVVGVFDVAIDVAPDLPDIVSRLEVTCPAPVQSVQSMSVSLTATATSSQGLAITSSWTVERAPSGSTAQPVPTDAPTTSFTFDTAGDWILRYTAVDTQLHRATCTVHLSAVSAIDLLCPNDQSSYQGATLALSAVASSRLGQAVTLQWSVDAAPMGSVSQPRTRDARSVDFLLDQLGDWRARVTATDASGEHDSCVVRLHADPDVIVTCPPDALSRPFASIMLAATAGSRLGLPLTYRWEIVDQPITSTASIAAPTRLSTPFTFDVAGSWTYRFTATNNRGNSAYCTTRARAVSDEAVRVEIVWNTDRSCQTCNAQGGGLDLDVHVTDATRAMGHWNTLAPADSDCYWRNCKCQMPRMLCPNGVLDWPPPGALDNPQLDIDHTGDLPGPENINIGSASIDSQFDVGVHFFGDNTPRPGVSIARAIVRVYCAGSVAFESESVGLGPVSNPSSDEPPSNQNPLWNVGRITVTPSGCMFARCGRVGDVTACIRPANRW